MIGIIFALGLAIAPQAVTDGDTFKLPTGERIRVSNIDTPEKGARAKCDAERFLAVHARAGLVALLGRGGIEITRLPANLQRDPWKRTLARVRVRGLDVGDAMIAQVLAVEWEGRRHDWCGAR